MEKRDWLQFISSHIKSQISLDITRKAQAWALALLGFFALGSALHAGAEVSSRPFLYGTKVLFLVLFHFVAILAGYLPNILQKGEKPAARLLGVRDFTTLTAVSLVCGFYLLVNFSLSSQLVKDLEDMRLSNFFGFAVWLNYGVALTYLLLGAFDLLSYSFFTQALVKTVEKFKKWPQVMTGVHMVLILSLGFAYTELEPVGSARFFEQLNIAGLFWTFILSMVFFLGKLLYASPLKTLTDLELEVISDRLHRGEDVLQRFKDASINRRLAFWIGRLSHHVASRSHEIAENTHEAVALIDHEKPSEVDLRKVEDRYKKAESIFKKFERENQKYLLAATCFDLNEEERDKIEKLRDLFSRELRNAKIELASVRKRIDERLLSIRNAQTQLPAPEQPAQQKLSLPQS
ncbi:MAG: hypothetical protein H6757_00575 [Candidatus Omnitrophica bacterium]|nr:hypothetical protein [Candidatus Omnitrophota bacterium]